MHVHDYVTCDCPNHAMVDGGSEYERTGWKEHPPVVVEFNPFITT